MWLGIMLLGIVCVPARLANADDPIVYPKNGQSPVQQGQDANECRTWAKRETGVDPAYLQGELSAMQSQQGESPQKRPIARGALRGVTTGAALGGISENTDPGAGRGAAMGVTAGAMRGVGQRMEMAREAKTQEAQKQVQTVQAQYARFNRAFSACMDGKGYSVS